MLIRFIDPDGREHIVDGEIGESVMRCATRALIPGILGECGGAMACGTCHCYVTLPEGLALPAPGPQERDIIEGCIDTLSTSRLTCQVVLGAGMEGITFTVPASQI